MTQPRGQLPRKLGKKGGGKRRGELTKVTGCGGRGLRGAFPLGQRHWKAELDCKKSTPGPGFLSGADSGGSPGTQRHGQCMQEQRRSPQQGDPLPVQARGPVVPPSSIEKPVKRRYAQAAPPGAHGHLGLPGIGDGVVGLHRGQIRGPVVTGGGKKKNRGRVRGWEAWVCAGETQGLDPRHHPSFLQS